LKYYCIDVKIDTNHKPSYFTGSMLRGAMGYALKKVTCINPSYQCEGCFAQSSCLYYGFYEKENLFHKYRFEIELGSGKFDFKLYLFDDACEGLPYVLSALEMALTKNGLTKNNYQFNAITMSVNGHTVYDQSGFSSLDVEPKSFKVDSYCPNIKLKLLTPIRVKKNNRLLTDDIDLEDILRSIYQKEQEFSIGKRAYKLDYEPNYETVLKALVYKPLLRKSGRQNKRMNMDGIVGEIALSGLDERSYELLKFGEVIGVGKQTVMGLGRIEVEDL
jgi:CRISPR-associated endoribonuclease Cas6